MRGDERGSSLVICYRLAMYELIRRSGRPAYVMVQRGFPRDAIAVGRSKREVINSVLMIGVGGLKFKDWAFSIQKLAQDAKKRDKWTI